MNELVEQVNKLLLAGEPGNITKADTNGYVGYEPQAIIDSMNEGFGIGSWGFEELSSETVDNEKGTLAVAQVRVWLKDIDFKPFAWGQSRVTRGDTGDAKKGAQTDAIKKALAYFSIGNRAYHGLLDKKLGNSPRTTKAGSTDQALHALAQPGSYGQHEAAQANGHQDTDKSTVAVTRGDLYTRGEEKGLWSRTSPDKFYAWASSISARPQSKNAWDMTVSEMGEMAKRIYAEPEVKKASAGVGK